MCVFIVQLPRNKNLRFGKEDLTYTSILLWERFKIWKGKLDIYFHTFTFGVNLSYLNKRTVMWKSLLHILLRFYATFLKLFEMTAC